MWFASFLLTSVTCLEPIVTNKTNIWNEQDARVFTRAIVRCEEKYPRSPCLNTFTKKAEGTFRAKCKDPFYFTKIKKPVRIPAFLRSP